MTIWPPPCGTWPRPDSAASRPNYGRYSPRTRTDLGNLARRFGLVATGGSDFHGATKPDLAVGTGTGDLRVPDTVLDQLESVRPTG